MKTLQSFGEHSHKCEADVTSLGQKTDIHCYLIADILT